MKILIVSPFPKAGDEIKGGVESVSYNLLQGFTHFKEIEVLLLSFHNEIKREIINRISDNVSIKYIPYGKIKSTKIELFYHAKKILYSTADEFKADIIHIQGNGSSLLLYKQKYAKQIIVTQHGILKEERQYIKSIKNKISHTLSMIIEEYYKKRVNNWIFISEYNKSLAYKNKFKIRNERLIFNPVNPNYFLNRQNISVINKKIYYVGSINRRKGLLDLIKAIDYLNNEGCMLNLSVIGGFSDEIYKCEILNYIKEHKLNSQVSFCGWKNSDEIIQRTSDIPVFVLPSYQETLPVVIAEAMAMGKIVVATNVAGIPEMVDDKISGFLYEKGDIKRLSMILKNIYDADNNYLSQLQTKAKEMSLKKFSPISVAKQTIAFYTKVIITR